MLVGLRLLDEQQVVQSRVQSLQSSAMDCNRARNVSKMLGGQIHTLQPAGEIPVSRNSSVNDPDLQIC